MKRPSLRDLASPKPGQAASEPQTVASDPEAGRGRAGAQPDGRKAILVRLSPEGWRSLRDLAAELTLTRGEAVTMQSLLLDSINGLLRQHGRPPVA